MPARRPTRGNRRATEAALRALLRAVGVAPGRDARGAPARAAALWHDTLLRGEHQSAAAALGRGMTSGSRHPVVLRGIGVHLVCPHHLTVAFGAADVAYVPGGRLASLGGLSDLVGVCTARLVLQEEATAAVVEALQAHLGAAAAYCRIDAEHPCHNLTRPRSHRARALTTAGAGRPALVRALARLVDS